MTYGFTKEQRSTFPYWFAHWCAFQMVALNLHIWKPKYLFHDIEKPWLRLFLPYEKVQHIHRYHNRHHKEWILEHGTWPDIDAMIIDNECSRFTKLKSPLTAVEYFTQKDKEADNLLYHCIYERAIKRAKELGL